jgi:hypothetical protein
MEDATEKEEEARAADRANSCEYWRAGIVLIDRFSDAVKGCFNGEE